MKLSILYSQEYEAERIVGTLKKIDWYNSNGYTVQLPDSLKVLDLKNVTSEEIKTAVLSEYNEQDYTDAKEYIDNHWSGIEGELVKNIKETSLETQEQYDIYLTKYGVGGSYHLPNTIITNIQRMFEFGLLKTIAHESIHLSIQPLVEKYKVNHWVKERIVDLILERLAPKVNSFQKIPIDTNEIDEAFKSGYPNIDKILKSLGTAE